MATLSQQKAKWQQKLAAKGHDMTWRRESGHSPFYVGTCRNCGGRVEVDDMGAETMNLGWGPRVGQCRGRG